MFLTLDDQLHINENDDDDDDDYRYLLGYMEANTRGDDSDTAMPLSSCHRNVVGNFLHNNNNIEARVVARCR